MKMQTACILLVLFVNIIGKVVAFTSETTYQNSIKFVYFNERLLSSTWRYSNFYFPTLISRFNLHIQNFLFRNESVFQPNAQCKTGENTQLAVIIHGWMESCETVWATTLMQSNGKFLKFTFVGFCSESGKVLMKIYKKKLFLKIWIVTAVDASFVWTIQYSQWVPIIIRWFEISMGLQLCWRKNWKIFRRWLSIRITCTCLVSVLVDNWLSKRANDSEKC